MGGIDRRPNGRWRARYRDGLGRQHSQTFDRQLDARRWLATVEVARSRGDWVDPGRARLPVGAWARSWLATQVQLKPSTSARYRVALDRHILPTWEKVPLAAVAYSDVSAWVATAFVSVGGKLTESTPKSHRHREVPLPRFLAQQLGVHIAGRAPKELVFSTASGSPLLSSNFRQRYWLDAVRVCGVAGLRVHDLRHTAASLAVKSGANPKVVQQMLGHASAAMTLDVYAGLFNADLDDVADRLDEAARSVAGVSWLCPGEGSEAAGETVDEGRGDDDDGLGGVAARVG